MPHHILMAGVKRRLRDEVFVIRIWTENDRYTGAAPWRASVTHVLTRECRFFTNYGELCEFLDNCKARAFQGS